jgi:ADP-ribosyl-[dinitrogen reductase] hydrolase
MENKFKGTLLGLAVGDALGGPLEFMSNSQVQIKHGTVNNMIGGGWLQLRPGQYTEDTVLTLSLTESLLEHKQLNIEDITKRYLAWYRTNPKDGGPITKAVFAYVAEGTPIEEAAKKAYEELTVQMDNNDCLVRCIPLALLYFQDPEKLIQQTLKAAMLTHYDKKLASGAVVVNLILSRILNGEMDRSKIMQQVSQLLDDNEAGAYNVLPDVASKKITELRTTSRMQDTLETALWGWWKTKSCQEAIVTVINLGGDTDTIAAITGALTGAYYGEENIPVEWLKSLEDKNIIANLGKRLFKLVSQR